MSRAEPGTRAEAAYTAPRTQRMNKRAIWSLIFRSCGCAERDPGRLSVMGGSGSDHGLQFGLQFTAVQRRSRRTDQGR